MTPRPASSRAAAYLLVFLTTYVVLFLVTRLLRGWIRSTDLAPLDRLFGALLGLGQDCAGPGDRLLGAAALAPSGPKDWHDRSSLASVFARGFDTMLAQVPDSYKQPVLESFAVLRDSVAPPASFMPVKLGERGALAP